MEENNPIQNSEENVPSEQNPTLKPKRKLPFALIFIVTTAAIVGIGSTAGLYLFISKNTEQVACTLEAKICPDGSSVGRTGPNCEFSPCPTIAAQPGIQESISDLVSFTTPTGWEMDISDPAKITVTSPDYRSGEIKFTESGIAVEIWRQEYSQSSCPFNPADTAGVSEAEEIIIDGNIGFSQQIFFEGNQLAYCVQRDNFTWNIRFLYSEADIQSFQQDIDLIISTFTFTDDKQSPHLESNNPTVSWQEAVSLIQNCEVDMVFQTHALDVTLTLKDGSKVTAKEPQIDDVFEIVKDSELTCGIIPIATE